MTNEEIIQKVNEWQEDDMIHEMVCGKEGSKHRPLYPVEEDGRIILKCFDCDYVQHKIPECVLIYSKEEQEKLRKALGINKTRVPTGKERGFF